MLQKFDPFLEFIYRIECKKHLIICLNSLYHKFSTNTSKGTPVDSNHETLVTEELNHVVNVSHNALYEKTTHFIISNSSPEIVYNDGGSSTHTNLTGCGYYFNLDRLHTESNVKILLKEKATIAVINTTLF